MRVLIVVNPNASRAASALDALADWSAARVTSKLVVTRSKTDLIRAVAEQGAAADRIVIGGGDGTISDALPHLLAIGKPLAVLPLGTANDFANTLGVPADIIAAAEVAFDGRPHSIDVGLVNGEPFVNVASIGVAANAAHAQTAALKHRWRLLSYPISLLHVARASKPFVVTLNVDAKPAWTGPVYQVSVGNGRFHGGGLKVADDAAIDDGKLDLYLVSPGPFWQLAACVTHLKFGFSKPALLQRVCATRVTITTSKPRPVNADGEIKTQTPAAFSLRRRGLTVIVPRTLPAGHQGLSDIQETESPALAP